MKANADVRAELRPPLHRWPRSLLGEAKLSFKGPCELLHFNAELAQELGLLPGGLRAWLKTQLSDRKTAFPQTNYAAHRLECFTPRLGDGRVHCLADVVGRGGAYEIQVKGAGATPFSGHQDGWCSLPSCVREYVASEFMHAQGVPSTRALAVLATKGRVLRSGVLVPAGLVVRVSRSFLRIGHLEACAVRQLRKERIWILSQVRTLLALRSNLEIFGEVARRMGTLAGLWQTHGFCHGGLGTDDVSMLGETLDYGGSTFLKITPPGYIANFADESNWDRFDRQEDAFQTNLLKLGQALRRLGVEVDLERGLRIFCAARKNASAATVLPNLRPWNSLLMKAATEAASGSTTFLSELFLQCTKPADDHSASGDGRISAAASPPALSNRQPSLY